MTGRHRKPRRLSKEGRRLLGGLALLAVFAPVTAYTLNTAIAHVRACGTETTLTVVAAPEIAAVLHDFVEAGGGGPSRGSDVCADITVVSTESTEIDGVTADVWVPENDLWLDIPEFGLSERWEVYDNSIASSAFGIAVPPGVNADALAPDTVDVALTDPRRDPASLQWLVMFGVHETTVGAADDPDAFPVMSAHQVRRHNAATGDDLQIPYGPAQVGQFTYPMLVTVDLDPVKREAASNLLRSFGSPIYPELLTEAGFRPPVPEPPARDESTVEMVLIAWDSYAASN
jgi:hypothetical protein